MTGPAFEAAAAKMAEWHDKHKKTVLGKDSWMYSPLYNNLPRHGQELVQSFISENIAKGEARAKLEDDDA